MRSPLHHLRLQHSSARMRAVIMLAADSADLPSERDLSGVVRRVGEKIEISFSEKRWDKVKRALQAYESREGHLLVPRGFTVSIDDEWEDDLVGLKLGYIVNNIRYNNAYKQYRLELEEMGFDYDPQLILYGWDLVERALQAYKERVGHLCVPRKFAIPNNDASWPKELWGMKLGNAVSHIRNDNHYEERRKELEAMGFDYSSQR
jgi:hypothetical protein